MAIEEFVEEELALMFHDLMGDLVNGPTQWDSVDKSELILVFIEDGSAIGAVVAIGVDNDDIDDGVDNIVDCN